MSAVLDALLYTFNSESSTLTYDQPVKFNYNYIFSDQIISQSEDKSSFYILKSGDYSINWWIAVQSGSSSKAISFAIKSTSNGQVKYQAAATPLKTGSLGGNSILSVSENEVPFKFELVNVTGYGEGSSVVVLALETVVQAGMTIIGVDNQIGPMGPAGEKGAQGPKGDRGEVGPRGDRGEIGPRGVAGPRGPIGERGPRGEVGHNGERGPMGPQGNKGDTGLQGLRGEKGDTGERGITGANGIDGISSVKKISSINSSIVKDSIYHIHSGTVVIFNQHECMVGIENLQFVSPSITMDVNGDINLLNQGIYDFSWYLAIVGAEQISELSISVLEVVDGEVNYTNPLIKCVYPTLITGAINGQGLFKIDSPKKVRLVNTSVASGLNSNGTIELNEDNEIKGSIKIIGYTI